MQLAGGVRGQKGSNLWHMGTSRRYDVCHVVYMIGLDAGHVDIINFVRNFACFFYSWPRALFVGPRWAGDSFGPCRALLGSDRDRASFVRPCWAHSFVGPCLARALLGLFICWALLGPFICWALFGKFICWALFGPISPLGPVGLCWAH